jgi:UDP-GlcNAc:undecaprenyl-phosphate GlcNAc-1-phosphate transferase
MLISFIFTFILSLALTPLAIKLAVKLDVIDRPASERGDGDKTAGRKIHTKATPLLGGLAIFLSFFVVLFLNLDKVLAGNLELKHWLGVLIGSILLMIGGFLDDKYSLKPSHQVIWPVLAILAVVIGGVGINKITNPFGGIINFNNLWFLPYVLTFLWLLGMTYTTKLLDGIDGLVTGISAIGGLIIFLFTLTTKYYQPDIAFASLIFSGACLGFLIFNFHPAKIFLGDGGSLLLGFLLGVLAIISGGKIAIALLVLGIPIMDAAWVIARRLLNKKSPFQSSDKLHLHHRLLALGIGQTKTVLIYYILALSFGLVALFLQSKGKVFALIVLVLVMLGFIIFLNKQNKNAN